MTKEEQKEKRAIKAEIKAAGGLYQVAFRIPMSRKERLDAQLKGGQRLTLLLAEMLNVCSVRDIEKMIAEKKAA